MAGHTAGGNPEVLARQARSQLMGAAATIDRLGDVCGPSMELLEARRAVHSALVALSGWGGSLDNDAPPGRVLAPT